MLQDSHLLISSQVSKVSFQQIWKPFQVQYFGFKPVFLSSTVHYNSISIFFTAWSLDEQNALSARVTDYD